MDKFTRGVLVVIAVALCAIAVRLWTPGYSTMGELQAAAQIKDEEQRKVAIKAWQARLPMVRIQGGTVDVDVSSMP